MPSFPRPQPARLHPIAAAAAVFALTSLAAHAQAPAQPPAEPPLTERQTTAEPERITVTGTRRETPASKVPFNITAIGEEALRERNLTDVKKLIQESIGLSAPDNGARFADSVTVRGLNVSPVNANNLEQFVKTTLSYYLDDTPLPNIGYRIKDVARVETLLGPQGTLYGAGSLGGTIRFITNKPRLGQTEARISTSFWQVKNGGLSNDTDVMLNLPIGQSVALRVSAAKLDEAGYIDRVSNPPWRLGSDAWTSKPDPNQNVYEDDDWQKVTGGRFSALWRIKPGLDITFAHTTQDQLAHGTSGVSLLPLGVANARTAAEVRTAWLNPQWALKDLPCFATGCRFTSGSATPLAVNEQTILSRYPEFADRAFRLNSIDIDWDLGFAALHSSTSQFKDTRFGEADYASQGWAYYSRESDSFTDFGADIGSNRSAYMTFDNSFKGISHETRITSKGSGPLQWIGGLYYTEQQRSFKFSEFLPGMQAYLTSKNRTLALPGGLRDEGYREDLASDYKETALFGEVGYRITPEWLVTVGARVFNYDDTALGLIVDYAGDAAGANRSVTQGDDGKSIFKLNTAYQVTPDILAYATASQGFRRGGTNPFRNEGARVLRDELKGYEPDTTNNYELGVKGYLFDRSLYLETAVYQIDWKDPQTYRAQTVGGVFPVNGTTNGPDARTRGFEISSRYKLNNNFQFSYSATRSEGEWAASKRQCLYEAVDSNGAAVSASRQSCRSWNEGGLLGGQATWKHNVGVRFNAVLPNNWYFWTTLNARYQGKVQSDRSDDPADNATVPTYPSFTRYSASIGVSGDKWSASLWGSNLTDVKVFSSTQASGLMGLRALYGQPRTVGLNLSYSFF